MRLTLQHNTMNINPKSIDNNLVCSASMRTWRFLPKNRYRPLEILVKTNSIIILSPWLTDISAGEYSNRLALTRNVRAIDACSWARQWHKCLRQPS